MDDHFEESDKIYPLPLISYMCAPYSKSYHLLRTLHNNSVLFCSTHNFKYKLLLHLDQLT